MPPSDSMGDVEQQNVTASGSLVSNGDKVRPPIAPVRQVLIPNSMIHPFGPYLASSEGISDIGGAEAYELNIDPFRDFRAETSLLEGNGEAQTNANGAGKKSTLDSLFRPPFDLIQLGPFANARETATAANKWLLVNIQNGREFPCQILNRDVWSHQTIKDIIKENFIFWQVYCEMYEGQKYAQFYCVTKWPHVSIIDPRTGEQMRAWPTHIDQTSFCDSVTDFLADFPTPDNTEEDSEFMETSSTCEKPGKHIDRGQEKREVITTIVSKNKSRHVSVKQFSNLNQVGMKTCDLFAQGPSTVSQAGSQSGTRNKIGPQKANELKIDRDLENSQLYAKPAYGFGPVKKNVNRVTAADALKAITVGRPKIKGPECKIALRFPDGSYHIQKFSAAASLKHVEVLVRSGKTFSESSEMEFVSPPFRRFSKANMHESLEALGLCPASRLEVQIVGQEIR